MIVISTIEFGLMTMACSVGAKSPCWLEPERISSKTGNLGGLYVSPFTINSNRSEALISCVILKVMLNDWSAGPDPVKPGLTRGTFQEVSYCLSANEKHSHTHIMLKQCGTGGCLRG
jgi:hypothetical protein